jgi:transcription initiation factor TFIIIB Brf1 subunit/transcription initiation factor TFIIB
MEFFSKIVDKKTIPGRAKTKAATLYYLLAIALGPVVTEEKVAELYSINSSSIRRMKRRFLKNDELSYCLRQFLEEPK